MTKVRYLSLLRFTLSQTSCKCNVHGHFIRVGGMFANRESALGICRGGRSLGVIFENNIRPKSGVGGVSGVGDVSGY